MKFTSAFFRFKIIIILLIFLSYQNAFSQTQDWSDIDSIKAGKFDTGKMWTFEYPPAKYFEEEYGFRPDEEWFKHVQLSTLKFADYCSASFVSEDGLIMSNNHCARQSITEVNRDGEDLHKDGFIAWEFEDERQVLVCLLNNASA